MDTQNDVKFKRLAAADQPKDRLYEMSLRFTADSGVRDLDDMIQACMPGEPLPRIQNAVTLHMKLTIPFIPDDDTIEEYCKIIEKNTKGQKTVLDGVRFAGYDWIYAVDKN